MADSSFVSRLRNEQISYFFLSQGVNFETREFGKEIGGKMTVTLIKNTGSKEHFEISDEGISNYHISSEYKITNEDWRAFLRKTFGSEYVVQMGYEDMPNDFVSRLEEEDIINIFKLLNYVTSVSSIREVDSAFAGTRRFKIVSKINEKEVECEFVLKPYVENSTEKFHSKSPKGRFIKYMIKKFGKEYLDYCVEHEKKNTEKTIQEYTDERNKDLNDLIAFANKTFEKRNN